MRPVRRAETLLIARADCLEILEPHPPGTLRACPSLYRDCFIFTYIFLCKHNKIFKYPKFIICPHTEAIKISATMFAVQVEKLKNLKKKKKNHTQIYDNP
jgi:hypothetical protein